MNPALIAYESQLQFNFIYADIYIKQAQTFSTTTGVRSGSAPVRVEYVPCVDVPVIKMFKAGPGGVPQQLYVREITFPLSYLGSNKVKLNDFVGLYAPYDPLNKLRYEIKSIQLTANTLITLGLAEQGAQAPGLTYTIPIGDLMAWTDTAEDTP